MTIEEKAKEYESNIGSQDYVAVEIEQAFIEGAYWMQEEYQKKMKKMLYKAVKWVKEYASDYAWYDFEEYYPVFEEDRFIRDFKKAMEE